MSHAIKAVAVQAGARLFDRAATLNLFAEKLTEAASAGADLVVFPEAFLGGYPKGIDFGVRVGSRNDAGRDQFAAYASDAVTREDQNMAFVRDAVARAGVNTVLGLIERDGGTLYCATATLARDGTILGWHRKLMPTAMERVIWGQGAAGPDGANLAVAHADIGAIGTAICWENYMPLYRAHLYHQGTVFYCAPTVDDREVWLSTMRMIALEGRCFVISACQFMTRADVASETYDAIQGNDPDTVLINGGSCIVSPMGEVLAGPLFGESGLITAILGLDDVTRGKFDLDVAGHYARPDVFDLRIRD